jgi:hypothetical protein
MTPPYRAIISNLHKVHVYAVVTEWGETTLFATAGTTGFTSETKGVNAKVYVKVLEEKLIPACRQTCGMYTHVVARPTSGIQR